MKNKIPLLLYFLALLISSCSTDVYGPALFHQDIAYQPKPGSFDTVKSVTYISGGLNINTDPLLVNTAVSGQFNLSRGHVFNHVNLAYGAFTVLGDYEGNESTGLFTYKAQNRFFGAVGGRVSANLFTKYSSLDFRYLGIEMAYSHEFGAYSDFRHRMNNFYDYNIDARDDLFTMGLTSEVLFHSLNHPHFQNGIRLFLGGTFGPSVYNNKQLYDPNSPQLIFRTIFPKISYFLKVNRFFATAEAGNQLFLRAGYSF